MSAVKKWLEIVANPPKCCLSCDHYMSHRGEWEEGAVCKKFEENPPREFVEEPNECEHWTELLPF